MNKIGKLIVIYILIVSLYPSISANAQRYNWNMNCVEQFTGRVSSWLETNDIEYRISAESTCSGKISTRVTDDLVEYLAIRNNQIGIDGSYTLDSYLNSLAKEMLSNTVYVKYSRPVFVNPSLIDKPNNKVDHYVCDVSLMIGSSINKSVKSLFYVVDGKISKIGKYLITENNKVSVDYSDFINDYETIGFSYSYGKHFPVGGSFNYSLEEIPFMLSVDFGVNLDGDKYVIDKVTITNIMNYEREKRTLDPKFFLTVTPQLYLKYFAIGCGVGFMYMDGTVETASRENTPSSGNESVSVSTGGSTSSTDLMFKPMIRPVVKGFIPLTDEFYLSLSAGYDMVFGYKDKNGFNVGLGFQWEL